MSESMQKFPKIQSVFKRDPATKMKTFLDEYSTPEIEYLAKNDWTFTEKIDGTNIRIGWDGERVVIGGRTDAAQIPASLVARLNELFTEDVLRAAFEDDSMSYLTLYGEGYGVKIQKAGAGYLPNSVDFILFDVRIGHWWLKRDSVARIAERIGCNLVPDVGSGTINDAIKIVSGGMESGLADCQAEGIVLRPMVDLLDRSGRRIITKLKTKDFGEVF